jgi:hypothetical protein
VGKKQPRHGMNLRDALRAARDLGCSIRSVNRTGEIIVSHPSCAQRIVVNSRRKDAPRALTAFLMAVQGFEATPAPRAARPANGPHTRSHGVTGARPTGGSRPKKGR